MCFYPCSCRWCNFLPGFSHREGSSLPFCSLPRGQELTIPGHLPGARVMPGSFTHTVAVNAPHGLWCRHCAQWFWMKKWRPKETCSGYVAWVAFQSIVISDSDAHVHVAPPGYLWNGFLKMPRINNVKLYKLWQLLPTCVFSQNNLNVISSVCWLLVYSVGLWNAPQECFSVFAFGCVALCPSSLASERAIPS